MASIAVIPATIVLAAAESGLPATLLAASSLVGTIVLAVKARASTLHNAHKLKLAETAQQLEQGKMLARMEYFEKRCSELEKANNKFETLVERRDEKIRELEHESHEQGERLETMTSILASIGIAIRDNKVDSAPLLAVWREYEMFQIRLRRGDTP